MAVQLANNAYSTLASGIGTGDTSLTVASGHGARFPSPTGGDWFPLTLVTSGGGIEIVKCTARSTDTLTVTRAQEGTTALSFSAGDVAELRLTAAAIISLSSAGSYIETLTASGTWTKPNLPESTAVKIQMWGGGGGAYLHGGGGGAYLEIHTTLSALSSGTYTIGAGGVGGVSPTNGGNTTFNGRTIYGGGHGGGTSGGGGGGTGGAANGSTDGVSGISGDNNGGFGNGGMALYPHPNISYWSLAAIYGGGRGGTTGGGGGCGSIYGGGGGGCSDGDASGYDGGKSLFGGNGGLYFGNKDGAIPAGGGSSDGSSGTGAGARGEIRITYF